MSKFETSEMIRNALGGAKFEVMTGACEFVTRGFDLQFKLPRLTKNKINTVKVEQQDDGTFTVCFYYIKGFKFKKIDEVKGVVLNDLVQVFEDKTGLDTTL